MLLLTAWVSLLAFTGCAPSARVKRHEAVFTPSSPVSEALAPVGVRLNQGRQLAVREPVRALGFYLAAAERSAAALRRDPSDKAALRAYNFSVARVMEVIGRGGINPWDRPVPVTGPEGNWLLAWHPQGDSSQGSGRRPSDYRLVPSDTLEISGRFFKTRYKADGLGAPLVVIGKQDDRDYRKQYSQRRIFGMVTALIRFRGGRAEIELYQPLVHDEVMINGRSHRLAADFSAPLAMLMTETHEEKLGFARLLRPERYKDTAALTRLQDYDPDRIPLVFVHGLDSTPMTWIPMITALREDDEIRRRYQIWVFSYPSGYAYPYAAMLLRRELDGAAKAFPGHKPAVLIGHSMGALISRLMITSVGDRIWLRYFNRPPGQSQFTGASGDLLKETLIFNSRQDVARSIFICGPHRGSGIASHWFGRLMSRLVQPPTLLADIRDSVLSAITLDPSALKLSTLPNSIDTLAPNNRFVRAINEFPIDSRVPYHSIIGDRGRGDTPNSSDGAVPYWSSHLEGAQSELIVPHNHGSHASAEGIAEVKRILRLHAGIPAAAASSAGKPVP